MCYLIKIVTIREIEIFIAINDIVTARKVNQNGEKCWRIETDSDVVWYAKIDSNEPFTSFVEHQIGGQFWERRFEVANA